jgi:hypothetical protein
VFLRPPKLLPELSNFLSNGSFKFNVAGNHEVNLLAIVGIIYVKFVVMYPM